MLALGAEILGHIQGLIYRCRGRGLWYSRGHQKIIAQKNILMTFFFKKKRKKKVFKISFAPWQDPPKPICPGLRKPNFGEQLFNIFNLYPFDNFKGAYANDYFSTFLNGWMCVFYYQLSFIIRFNCFKKKAFFMRWVILVRNRIVCYLCIFKAGFDEGL